MLEDREPDVERDSPDREWLREALDWDRGGDGPRVSEGVEKRSIRERLNDVLNKPYERLEFENELELEKDS